MIVEDEAIGKKRMIHDATYECGSTTGYVAETRYGRLGLERRNSC